MHNHVEMLRKMRQLLVSFSAEWTSIDVFKLGQVMKFESNTYILVDVCLTNKLWIFSFVKSCT